MTGFQLTQHYLEHFVNNEQKMKQLDACVKEYYKSKLMLLPSKEELRKQASRTQPVEVHDHFQCSVFAGLAHFETYKMEYDNELDLYVYKYNIDGDIGYNLMT